MNKLIIYKTSGRTETYQCPACSTTFRQDDLQFDCQHKVVGKYSVQPDVSECPLCGFSLNTDDAEVVEREIPNRDQSKKVPFSEGIPRTVHQNCISGNHTVKSQIDWENERYTRNIRDYISELLGKK